MNREWSRRIKESEEEGIGENNKSQNVAEKEKVFIKIKK